MRTYFSVTVATSTPSGRLSCAGWSRVPYGLHYDMSIHTIVRLFLIVQPLIRKKDDEVSYAPYKVFTIDPNASLQTLSINEVQAVCVHMAQRTRNSWWWNPYINFI